MRYTGAFGTVLALTGVFTQRAINRRNLPGGSLICDVGSGVREIHCTAPCPEHAQAFIRQKSRIQLKLQRSAGLPAPVPAVDAGGKSDATEGVEKRTSTVPHAEGGQNQRLQSKLQSPSSSHLLIQSDTLLRRSSSAFHTRIPFLRKSKLLADSSYMYSHIPLNL